MHMSDIFDPTGVLDALDLGVWVFEFEHERVVWANRKALAYWQAGSLAELRARDLSSDMSPSVRLRLAQYRQDFLDGKAPFYERWTLYPHGEPINLQVRYSGITDASGRMHLLCEAVPSLQREPDSLRSVDALLHTVDMVALYALDGEVLYCNPAARVSFDRQAPAQGSAWRARFADPAQADAVQAEVAATGMGQVVARVAVPDEEIWHRITATRCHDPLTGKQAFLVTEQDVTETELTKRALERSRNAALRESRAKSDFVAVVSHELRNPLNGVVGATEILRDQTLADDQRALVDVLWHSSRDLLTTINGILDLAKIEANEVATQAEPFDLSAIVTRVVRNHQTRADAKGVVLAWHATTQDDWRRGDPGLLTQILHNLVGNAVKFTETGTVDIALDTSAKDALVIDVTDTGIGLSKADIARIPKAFEQADSSTSRTYGGTGLGLTIVQKILTALGGQMKITSTLGQGTQVQVRVPFAQTQAPATTGPAGTASDRRVSARALVVDDMATNTFLLSKLLEARGFDVATANSGAAAVELARTTAFDFFLCDIAMPDMDGPKTLSALRAVEAAKGPARATAIAVTANAFDHQIAQYLSMGFDDCLSKPITKTDIERVVTLALTEQA